MQVHAGALEHPAPDRRGLVRGRVVEDQVQVELRRRSGVDGVEEVPELDRAVALVHLDALFQPPSVRSTLVQLGQTLCKDAEAFKAWSQNLGHEGVLTTLHSYGEVSPRRQAEIPTPRRPAARTTEQCFRNRERRGR